MPPAQSGTLSAPSTAKWYQMYFAAVMEADEGKAVMQIRRASTAIEERLLELRYCSPDNLHEIQDLTSALIYLRLLLRNIDSESESRSWQ